jgi:hypothetical protein
MSDIHSCSYFCERPDCVLSQRNELRDRLTAGASAERTWQLAEIEVGAYVPPKQWVGLTLEERMNLGAGFDADIYYPIEAALKEKNT